MKRFISVFLASVVFLFGAILAACAPSTAPAPQPPAATPPPAPKAAPVVNAEDSQWAKIVNAAKKEEKITAYSYTWAGDTGLIVERAFEKQYGIDLQIITGRGAEFTERLKTEKRMGQIVADITEGSNVHINNMKMAGLLASVTGDLPSLREKGVWALEPEATDPRDKINLAFRIISYTPYINTKMVKPADAPKSWRDLLEPKWKGLMTLTDPNISPSTIQTILVLIDNKAWDEAYVKALYGQKLRYILGGFVEEFRILATGESSLMVIGSDADADRFAREGAPIQAIDMKEGAVVTTASVAAIGNSPHPNAAKVLMNWLYSHEGQSVAGKAQGNKMVRKDVPDFRPAAAQTQLTKPFVMTNEQLDKSAEMFKNKWFDKLVGR